MKKLNIKRVIGTAVLGAMALTGGSVIVDTALERMDHKAEVQQRNLEQHLDFAKQQRIINSINE